MNRLPVLLSLSFFENWREEGGGRREEGGGRREEGGGRGREEEQERNQGGIEREGREEKEGKERRTEGVGGKERRSI